MKARFFYSLNSRAFQPLFGPRTIKAAFALARASHPNAGDIEVISRTTFIIYSLHHPDHYSPEYL